MTVLGGHNGRPRTAREQGSKLAMLGFLQAVLGVAGGIYGFQKYNSMSEIAIGGLRCKRLTLASLAILVAALMSVHNCFSFITAGVLNGVAGMIAVNLVGWCFRPALVQPTSPRRPEVRNPRQRSGVLRCRRLARSPTGRPVQDLFLTANKRRRFRQSDLPSTHRIHL
jgi:hypothetical protein